jgi:hypothetical protein
MALSAEDSPILLPNHLRCPIVGMIFTFSSRLNLQAFLRMLSPAPMSTTVFRRLAVIGVVVMAEPLSATLLFPYVYFMVRGFNVEDQYIGLWAGIIS